MAKLDSQYLQFGSAGGDGLEIVDPYGSSTIQIYSYRMLDSIRINGKLYGGMGGAIQPAVNCDASGYFTLTRIQTAVYEHSLGISYFEAVFGNTTITAGDQDNNDNKTVLQCSLRVRFKKISYGRFIDAILFELAP